MPPPPHPFALLAELTYACPLRCPYCSNPTTRPRGEELQREAWLRLIDEAAALGVVQVHLSGGEPTLRPDLPDLVARCARLGLYTNLITSAYRLDDEGLARLEAAGLDHVQVSVQDAEAASSDRIAGTPSYARKLEAMARVKARGLPLTVNVVLHRANLDRIEAILALAESAGADRLELAHTQYYGWALENRDALLPTRAQLARAFDAVEAARGRLAGRMQVVHVMPDYFTGEPKACMDGWARRHLTVTPDGRALPCPVAGDLPLDFVRVTERPLDWIWFASPAFAAYRGDAWMQEPCRSCPRKDQDYGGCRCQAFALTGDAAATDPACRLSPRHQLVAEAVARAESGTKGPHPAGVRYRTAPEAGRLTPPVSLLDSPPGGTGMTHAEAMHGVAEQILEDRWRTSPVTATLEGIHRYDDQLDDVGADSLADAAARHRAALARLAGVDPGALSVEDRLDHAVLAGHLEAAIDAYEHVRAWQKDASGYANTAIYAVFPLALRRFAPAEVRAEAAASRLAQVDRLLRQARANLEAATGARVSPRLFTETAIEVVRGCQAFLAEIVPGLAETVASRPLKARLIEANAEAMAAFADYLEWLRGTHLARSTGSFAIGRAAFDLKLRAEHGLTYDAEQLAVIGREAMEQAERDLAALARTIDPDRSWIEQVEAQKRDHPTATGLLDAYRGEMARARAFVVERRLVTLPPGESLEVVETPLFERPLIPYAAMMPPAPFDEEQKSLFYVTPVDPTLAETEQWDQLKGHPTQAIPVTALHEAYPGHHLQLSRANRIASRVRRVVSTPVFVEGWALYCEEMMYEAGFYPDPRVRLFQLKDLLWRACRVVLDVGLHCEGMTPEAAVDLLVTRAHLERRNAEAEVRRYCATPTQPMSYLIGRREILALRDVYRERAGKHFSLGAFHDALLSHGSIPVALVGEALLSRPPTKRTAEGRA